MSDIVDVLNNLKKELAMLGVHVDESLERAVKEIQELRTQNANMDQYISDMEDGWRAKFAGMFMQGYISALGVVQSSSPTPNDLARYAVQDADTLIAELKESHD